MPTRQQWKKPRTFRYEVDSEDEFNVETGTIEAYSIHEARLKAKARTEKLGYKWKQRFGRGWMKDAIEGTQGWINSTDGKFSLWVYVPKPEK